MVISSLRAALKDPDAKVRAQATKAIGYMGPDAAEAAPDLVMMVVSGVDAAEAMDALREIGEAAVPHILPLLDEDGRLRKAAEDVLALLGCGFEA